MGISDQPNIALLEAWSHRGDREAVAELVRRHIGFVQGVARRCAGVDNHLAEDITQAVFILLLRKADRIHSEAAMTSWLYTTTRYAASNAIRMLCRQKHREVKRVREQRPTESQENPLEASELASLLQDALDQLPRNERVCVTMSYLQEKTHAQVAAALGVSPDAARKRIYRGVERMRTFLMARGVVTPAGAVGAGLALKGAPASAALIQSTTNVAMLAQAPNAATAASIIAEGAAHMLLVTKIKGIGAAVAATGLFVACLAGVGALTTMAGAPAPVPAATATGEGAKTGANRLQLGQQVTVEILGVASIDGSDWHDIAGKAIDAPPLPQINGSLMPPPTHQVLARIISPRTVDVVMSVSGSRGDINSVSGETMLFAFVMTPGAASIDFNVLAADGKWREVASADGHLSSLSAMSKWGTSIIFFPPVAQDGGALVNVAVEGINTPTSNVKDQWRIICRDSAGRVIEGTPNGGASSGNITARSTLFKLGVDQIGKIVVESRPYNRQATVKHIPLNLGGPPAEIVMKKDESP